MSFPYVHSTECFALNTFFFAGDKAFQIGLLHEYAIRMLTGRLAALMHVVTWSATLSERNGSFRYIIGVMVSVGLRRRVAGGSFLRFRLTNFLG